LTQRSLKGREEVLGKEHPDTMISVTDLAMVLHSQCKDPETEMLYWKALVEREEVLGKNHPDNLTGISDLAAAFRDQRNYMEVVGLYRKVFIHRLEVLGKEHPDILTSVNNVALILCNWACGIREGEPASARGKREYAGPETL
jgi:hypothetical protein